MCIIYIYFSSAIFAHADLLHRRCQTEDKIPQISKINAKNAV